MSTTYTLAYLTIDDFTVTGAMLVRGQRDWGRCGFHWYAVLKSGIYLVVQTQTAKLQKSVIY